MKNKKHIFSWVIQQAANGWDKFGRNSFDFTSPGVMFGNSPGVMFGLVSHFMTPVFSRWMWENLQSPTSGEDCFPGCFRHFRMAPQKLLGCFCVSKLLKRTVFNRFAV